MITKFYRCPVCGQTVSVLDETGVPLVCCGRPMEELIPGVEDASHEKHVPVYKVRDGKVWVSVGSVPHPMTGSHYIQWIAVTTGYCLQIRDLSPGDKPEACFSLCEGEDVEGVYAFCNLHFLWMA